MFQFLFCYILERKDKKWFKRDIIVLMSFLILFVSISFLVNIGKEMSLPGFRNNATLLTLSQKSDSTFVFSHSLTISFVFRIDSNCLQQITENDVAFLESKRFTTFIAKFIFMALH